MKERIRKLRRELDVTQQEFADRIGMKRNTIANYETGRNEPSASVISLICREFNVNEEWLRSGSGDMFVQRSQNALSAIAEEYDLSASDLILLEKFVRMKPASRKVIENYIVETAKSIMASDIFADIPDTPEELEKNFPPIDVEDKNQVG